MNSAHRPLPRLPHAPRLLLASAFALTALGAAPALSEPAAAPTPRALPDPLHPCTVLLCLPEPGKAAPSTAPAAQPTSCAATTVQPVEVASDPEEGGQIARTAKPKPKPKISDMTVTKKVDTASPTLAQSAPSGSVPCTPGQQ